MIHGLSISIIMNQTPDQAGEIPCLILYFSDYSVLFLISEECRRFSSNIHQLFQANKENMIIIFRLMNNSFCESGF